MTDNLDQYEEEIYAQQNQQETPFERDQDISRHLLAVGKYKGRSINEDSPRANNNPLELQATRSAARVINRLEYAEKMFGWDFTNLIEFFEGTRAITDVTGRGKHGWVATLTKSNYNIQQAEAFATDVATDFGEEAEQSIQEKISNKIPFLKKKEM
jgi:hypothetical protein